MKNKKGAELSLNVIVIAAMTLVVLTVSIMVFTGLIGDSVGDAGDLIQTTSGDYDGDGIKDIVDKCPCIRDDAKIEYEGCPEKITDENRERLTSRACLS
ncbi:MAG: hypothetical protein KKE93_02165 [Nanoarchaeota archaeon]|nr:hypothetical protein [Nanoarchaeota archaeon]